MADEEAAIRLQEQIWLADEAAAEEANNNNNNNNNPAADNDNDNAAAANNNNNNNNDNAAGVGGLGPDINAGAQNLLEQLLAAQNAVNNNNNNNNDDAGNNNNNNNNIDNDDAANNDDNNDDEQEDEDDDDDDSDNEDDGNNAENRRGAIDAGIAGEVRDENSIKITRALKCPLVLYLECCDDLDTLLSPNNTILKRGTTVYIGLDKNTKLSLVFHQYCKFVNSKIPKNKGNADVNTLNSIKLSDLEFQHCTLLDANQTVEASAMMKNDRIKVYRERSKERSTKTEVMRQQRESDRKYFKDLRQLLPNPSPEGIRGCDVVLDCRGKVMDERGFSQNVMSTTVRANSVLISKRCKWLGQRILAVREDIRRRAEMTVDDEDDADAEEDGSGSGAMMMMAAAAEGGNKSSGLSDDEDDIIMGEESAVARAAAGGDGNINNNNNNNGPPAGEGGGSAATKVEDYDDEEEEEAESAAVKVKAAEQKISSRKSAESSSAFPNSLWVSLDHSPQAVKLLLEFCYTNRVQSLGQEAFAKACKHLNPKEVGALAAKQAGPVPPFRKHEWPDGGSPTISLHLALAGIALAEEAHMPRLSLMCEIAASQLVNKANVIDVLCACQVQQQKTGNRLPYLRKAAMLDAIMVNGSSGIDQLYNNPTFKSNLHERRGLVIPSLLDGTVEVMPTNMNTKEIRKKKDRMALEKRKIIEL